MSDLIESIKQDIQKRMEELLPAVQEHEKLTEADTVLTSVIGQKSEPNPEPTPEPKSESAESDAERGELILNTNKRRAIEKLPGGQWQLWTFKRKSDESYKYVGAAINESAAMLWLKGAR